MKPARYPADPIVLVDDEPRALDSLEILFQSEGLDHVIKLADPVRLFETLETRPASLVLLDLIMPGLSGESLLEPLAQRYPDVPVIVVTAKDTVATAVSCMKHGAFDFIVKPVDTDRLLASVRHALGLRELRRENRDLRDRLFSGTLTHPEHFAHIVARSPGMRAVLQYVETIAPSRHPVLVTGETGVGKELVARALHDLSGRQGPFVSLNVAGLDDTLFADTLFGHVKGAFTGAVQPRGGLVSRATDGTLFLDEIGDLSQSSQMKLLRLVQEAEYFPVGSDSVRRAKTRIVAATNHDLREALAAGRFRNDLYFRLSAHEIAIPPLRKRPEDIPALADFFLEELCRERGVLKPSLPDEWLEQLRHYEFPGNARELKSMVIDVFTQAGSAARLSPEAERDALSLMRLLPRIQSGQDATPTSTLSFPSNRLPTIRESTRSLIEEALRRSGGNQSAAARMLGISQQALSKRLSKYNTRR
jgi:DNA-binding NtrC family response regulator